MRTVEHFIPAGMATLTIHPRADIVQVSAADGGYGLAQGSCATPPSCRRASIPPLLHVSAPLFAQDGYLASSVGESLEGLQHLIGAGGV